MRSLVASARVKSLLDSIKGAKAADLFVMLFIPVLIPLAFVQPVSTWDALIWIVLPLALLFANVHGRRAQARIGPLGEKPAAARVVVKVDCGYTAAPTRKASSAYCAEMFENERDDPEKTLKMFHEATAQGVVLDRNAYNAALYACQQCGLAVHALDIYDKMLAHHPPNSKTFSVVIGACTAGGKYLQAIDIYDVMIQSGLRPTSLTYNDVIHCYIKEGMDDAAIVAYEEMKASNNMICYDNLIPSALKVKDEFVQLRDVDKVNKSQRIDRRSRRSRRSRAAFNVHIANDYLEQDCEASASDGALESPPWYASGNLAAEDSE